MLDIIRGLRRMMVGVGLVCAFAASGFAIDLAKDTAIRLAPEDCDLFWGGMQLQEQWKRFTDSKLFRDVAGVPITQKVVEALREQWEGREGQVGQIRNSVENPNVESVLKLVQDMFSQENFIIADSQTSELVVGINSLSEEITAIAGSGDVTALFDYFMQLPKSEIDNIPIPTLVMGFKVRDHERVLGKIDELGAILRIVLGSFPEAQSFLEGLERVEDARGTRLSWTVIPEMIPWTQLRRNMPLDDNGQISMKIQELLEDRQICITLGQLDEYLVLAISEEPEAIAKLGKSGSLLQNPDLKPLIEKVNESITSISYVSDAYADAYFQSQLKDFFVRQYPNIQQTLLGRFGDKIPDGLNAIQEDLAWVDEQIEELIPDLQGQTAFSFVTKNGSELWNYTRTENVILDGSKPLSVLEHLGKDPIALIAFRLQDHPEYFATARRIVRKLKEYLDVIPELEILSASEKEMWNDGLDRGWPLVVELADIIEKQFLPSIKDGQHAWVLADGSLSSTKWLKEMPESSKPLPLPQIAILTGITSKTGMSEAWSSLFKLCDSIVELVRELKPDSIPSGYKVPRPTEIKDATGERYGYPIRVDPSSKSIMAEVLITDSLMISSYGDQQIDLRSKSQTLSVVKEVIKPDQHYAAVSYVDCGRALRLVKPWIVYAIETLKGDLNEQIIEAYTGLPAVKGSDIVELWTAFESAGQIASVTTQANDGGSVSRSVFTER